MASKKRTYQNLGPFTDLVAAARKSHALFPVVRAGRKAQRAFVETLGFNPRPAEPIAARVESKWRRDGIAGELVSWSVGYGPRTEAWLLRPEGARGRLPGVLALHDHGGFKYFGKEKIADGPGVTASVLKDFREAFYGGKAFANELALRGFCVLVPDTFGWGSRKFPLEVMAKSVWRKVELFDDRNPDPTPEQASRYNELSAEHEHTMEKYCAVLGTTLSGLISYEDRVAAAYLTSRPDVQAQGIGCVGLSGGGLRATLLQATCSQIRAAVVVGMMSTYEGLLDHNMSHTWGLFPHGWSRRGDWPDVAACRAPSPLMVQYDLEDQIFSREGMRAAHRRLQAHYRAAGKPRNYVGRFYPGLHKFDLQMQKDAFDWLARQLKA